MQLELEIKDLLDALAYEKERAKKFAVFENQIENLKNTLSFYEKEMLKTNKYSDWPD